MSEVAIRMPQPQPRQKMVLACPCDEILYGGAAGAGKALAITTPILTTQGWRTMGDLEIGDEVFGSDGKPTKILTVSPIMHGHRVFDVIFDDGSVVRADAEHLWVTRTYADRLRLLKQTKEWREARKQKRPSRGTGKRPDLAAFNVNHAAPRNIPCESAKTTLEILETLKLGKRINHSIDIAQAIELPEAELLIHPYVLGVWLGDGNRNTHYLACNDDEIIQKLDEFGQPCFKMKGKFMYRMDALNPKLKALGLINNKHVPEVYLRGSIQQRLDLLRGLMDTDGTCSIRGASQFSNKNGELIRAVRELAVSLGLKPTVTSKMSKMKGKECGICYTVSFTTTMPVFYLTRKLARLPKKLRGVSTRRYIVDVYEAESEPVRCIGVMAPDRLYLAGASLIPTHNTFALLLDYLNHAIAAEAEGKKSSGVLFRKTFRELEDLVRESREMYSPLGWKFGKDRMEWISPHGSILRLSFLASMDDAYGHRGFEYDWIGRDELTLWGTDEEYEYLNTRLRSSSGVRCRQVSTTNPGGPGHSWVMRRWQIDKFPDGMKPIKTTIKLSDGREMVRTRIFIPGRLKDNIYLASDGQYEANLKTNPPHIQKMLLDGRWDVIEGAFFHEWDPAFHTTDPFILPEEWTRWVAMDWGSVHPYCVLWFAQSPSGEIYIYRELYGDGSERFGGKSNVGTRESGAEVGRKILALEDAAGELIRERYADSQIWQNMGHQFTVGDDFRQAGVVFTSAAKLNKAHSINLLRNAMRIVNGYTQLKIFKSCVHLIRQIPAAIINPNDPNTYDPRGETHALDACLYGLRKNTNPEALNIASRAIKINARRASQYGPFGVQ